MTKSKSIITTLSKEKIIITNSTSSTTSSSIEEKDNLKDEEFKIYSQLDRNGY